MLSAWNIVGLLLWIALIVYAVFIIHNIAVRRSRIIINEHYNFTFIHHLKSFVQILILFVGIGFMFFQTFKTDVNTDNVNITRSYQPLILDTNGNNSYYVRIKSGSNPNLNQSYHYLVKGKRLSVSSNDASVLVGTSNAVNVQKSAVKWNQHLADKLDSKYQRAWIVDAVATYKKSFWNGIGLHAGHQARRYTLIRVPDNSFIYNK